jgi:hypothetical protein
MVINAAVRLIPSSILLVGAPDQPVSRWLIATKMIAAINTAFQFIML